MKISLKKNLSLILSITLLTSLFTPFVHADETISVSGSIPPTAADFQVAMTNNASGTRAQNDTATFTITYGSHLYHSENITVEASWYQGTISGDSSPSVDGMDYVTGSAGNAYNNTSPVVDLTNHKITWSISSFPAQTTDQTVSFTLKMNGSYTGSQSVDFPVKARLLASNFTTSYVTNDLTYQYNASLVTPTPTPGPTNTPTSTSTTPTPTGILQPPSPTPTPTPIYFENISIDTLISNEIDIGYILSSPATVNLRFGNSPTSLVNIQQQTTQNENIFSVLHLSPQTIYYFQLVLPDGSTSEIFTFTTPIVSDIPEVAPDSLVISNESDVLYSSELTKEGNYLKTAKNIPIINIAPSSSLTFAFRLVKNVKVKTIVVQLRPLSILGATTIRNIHNQPIVYTFTVYDKGNGVYITNITNTLPPGYYSASVHIVDTNGNITTGEISQIHILQPFRTLDSKTHNGVSDVKLMLYRYDNISHQYSLVPSTKSLSNPLYTNELGAASVQLPNGKYKVVAAHLGYVTNTVYFQLGISVNDDYPTIYMSPTAITPLAFISYYTDALLDYIHQASAYITSLRVTHRFFDLIGLIVMISLIILLLLLFRIRSKIALHHLPFFLHHHTLKTFGSPSNAYIHGFVKDQLKHPLAGAVVSVVDQASKKVLAVGLTNNAGGFLIPFAVSQLVSLLVVKEGYTPSPATLYVPNGIIVLSQTTNPSTVIKHSFLNFLESLSGFAFIFILVLTLLLELIMLPSFGILTTLPFFLGSLLNVILFLFYLRERYS